MATAASRVPPIQGLGIVLVDQLGANILELSGSIKLGREALPALTQRFLTTHVLNFMPSCRAMVTQGRSRLCRIYKG